MSNPQVILSGFADEAVNRTETKSLIEQFTAFSALGLQYYSVRFVDLGDGAGTKNVMKLSMDEIQQVKRLQDEYGLNASSIGSPIGKVKLIDQEDGTKNVYIPFDKYLKEDVARACDIAHAFECKLIRGFSFYHPHGQSPRDYMNQTVDQLGQIAEACHRSDLTFGLEPEPNLVGSNGWILAEIYKKVNHPGMVLIFDGANLVVQGYTQLDLLSQFRACLPGLGWLHIKDYHNPQPVDDKPIDEESLWNFVPSDRGDSGHEAILRELREYLPDMEQILKRRGLPGVFCDLEPHVKGGGQFGGYSGPDGFGIALRAFCRLLDYTGIDYHLRNFDDLKAARGF